MKTFQGTLSATGRRFGIVISRFNSLVTTQLLNGAVDCLLRHGGTEDALTVVYVAGLMQSSAWAASSAALHPTSTISPAK
jgi:6,7-dimethyl-8-ribityllumazine synthase